MEKVEAIDSEAMVDAQALIYKQMLSFAESMALKCAVELRIADIIHSHGCPVALSEIVAALGSPSADTASLRRIMRFLVRKKIFASHPPPDQGGETLYGLTPASKLMIHGAEISLAPMILMENDPRALAPWHCFSGCVREGGVAFKRAHGKEIWEYGSENPDFSNVFNSAMECATRITTKAIVLAYREGFSSIGSLVDVGGGTGAATAEIVKAYPHLKGINLDLPHVIATAPEHPGISHVGGDMFEAVPNADAVFMKWILHDWSDEDCIKILKNCRKAIPEKTGKVIIVELVLKPEGEFMFDETGMVFDLVMIAHSSGGKERTESEWKKLLEEAGFPRYNIVQLPALQSIIEAFPF